MAAVLDALEAFVAPWAKLYSDSIPVQVVVIFAHIAALFVGGGLALASDRAVLRARRAGPEAQRRVLAELRAVHRLVLLGLGVALVTGLMLTASDVKVYAVSVPFWVKMSLLVLLLANGAWLTRVESGLQRSAAAGRLPWRQLSVVSACSIALWLATTLAGVVLTNKA